jgi:hypothetical protein
MMVSVLLMFRPPVGCGGRLGGASAYNKHANHLEGACSWRGGLKPVLHILRAETVYYLYLGID